MAKTSELAKIVASYKEVFKSGPGQVVLDDMQKSWYKRVSHTKGDPYETAFKEGQRSVVVRIQCQPAPCRRSSHASTRAEEEEAPHASA